MSKKDKTAETAPAETPKTAEVKAPGNAVLANPSAKNPGTPNGTVTKMASGAIRVDS